VSARHKLNIAYINGAVIIGGIAGLVFNSFTVFVATTIAMVVFALHDGNIRTRPRR